jgi:hypothetical protein
MGIVFFTPHNHYTYHQYKTDAATVQSSDNPHSWKIATASKDTKAFEEMVFTVHGIICGKDLPPVMD